MTGIPNVNFVLNGSLAGLVAITAGCHAVSPAEAIIIGAVGGAVMLFCTKLLDALKLDDAVGAIPVHLAAGIWGTLAVGIFGDPAVLMTDPVMGSQFLAQLIGVASCGVWAFGLAFISLKIVNAIHPMRVVQSMRMQGSILQSTALLLRYLICIQRWKVRRKPEIFLSVCLRIILPKLVK